MAYGNNNPNSNPNPGSNNNPVNGNDAVNEAGYTNYIDTSDQSGEKHREKREDFFDRMAGKFDREFEGENDPTRNSDTFFNDPDKMGEVETLSHREQKHGNPDPEYYEEAAEFLEEKGVEDPSMTTIDKAAREKAFYDKQPHKPEVEEKFWDQYKKKAKDKAKQKVKESRAGQYGGKIKQRYEESTVKEYKDKVGEKYQKYTSDTQITGGSGGEYKENSMELKKAAIISRQLDNKFTIEDFCEHPSIDDDGFCEDCGTEVNYEKHKGTTNF